MGSLARGWRRIAAGARGLRRQDRHILPRRKSDGIVVANPKAPLSLDVQHHAREVGVLAKANDYDPLHLGPEAMQRLQHQVMRVRARRPDALQGEGDGLGFERADEHGQLSLVLLAPQEHHGGAGLGVCLHAR
jgi:hypothetical protein